MLPVCQLKNFKESFMYHEMLDYVKKNLQNNDIEATKIRPLQFRKRSEHTFRVYNWANRLLVNTSDYINKEIVLIAAIFHDVGYAKSNDKKIHAQFGSDICNEYLQNKNFDKDLIASVVDIIKNHSNKNLLYESTTSKELIILMEADMLDETGALSILWDCMSEGSENIQSYEKTYEHIKNYSVEMLSKNPMVTPNGIRFWEEKQSLLKLFLESLKKDIGY